MVLSSHRLPYNPAVTTDPPIDPIPTPSAPSTPGHLPVLVAPILRLFEPKSGQVMLDCTVGRGGHAAAIIPHLAPGGRYIGLDVDPSNLEFTRNRLTELAKQSGVQLDLIHCNFAAARTALTQLNISRVDLLLADFGFSSNQMSDPQRGFSFQRNGPLDMRLDPTSPTTAADLVNEMGEKELADLIYQYGEDRASRRIARKIVEARRESPINTTEQLADVVRLALGMRPDAWKNHPDKPRRPKPGRIDPATRTFMALRIAVNGELDVIHRLLAELPALMKPGGIAGLISFHSLEDRPVKQAFLELAQAKKVERLTHKPVTADDEEIAGNPRSRSAKLRVIRFVKKDGKGRAKGPRAEGPESAGPQAQEHPHDGS